MSEGVRLIAEERQRQIDVEGWTPEHDDAHRYGEIAWAAVCYAAPGEVLVLDEGGEPVDPWPWEDGDKRPTTSRLRRMVKAGALIAAEIERLQRAGVT